MARRSRPPANHRTFAPGPIATLPAKRSVESLGQTVEGVIESFAPRTIDTERWALIAGFVRDAVRDLDVPEHIGRGHLGSYLLVVSQLAAWASIHYPLERDRIFDPKVIEAFHSRQQTHLAPATAINRKKLLVDVGRRLNPKWDGPGKFGSVTVSAAEPYSPSELRDILDWAGSQGSETRRSEIATALALSLGAGLRSEEVMVLKVADVEVTECGVLIHTSASRGQGVRTAPVRVEWEAHLIDRVAGRNPEDMVFLNGHDRSRCVSVGQYFHRASGPSRVRPPNSRRLRNTWIVGHILDGVPIEIIAQTAGLSYLGRFARWIEQAPKPDPSLLFALMRGAGGLDGKPGPADLRLVTGNEG